MKKIICLMLTALLILSACVNENGSLPSEEEPVTISDTRADIDSAPTTTTTPKATAAPPAEEPEKEPLNASPDGLSDEELELWDIIAEHTDKPIEYYDIADYENNGQLVMFAAVNDERGANNFDLWFTDGTKTELIETVDFRYKFEAFQFGEHRYFIRNPMARMVTGAVFGVKDGEVYTAFEMWGQMCASKECQNQNEIILDTPGDGISWIYYWLFYEEETREFKEYGGVEITLEQFMTFENAEEILEMGKEYELISILYRGNNVINLNFHVEATSDEWDNSFYYSVIARVKDNMLVFENTRNSPYRAAYIPEIAVYPDITGLFN